MTYPTIKADAEGIVLAAQKIKAGEVIVVPTETVYGIVADATNAEAVKTLYKIKRRSDKQPCQVLIRDVGEAEKLAYFDKRAEKLAKAFWPGPLTLILPFLDSTAVADEVLADEKTIGLRVPNHAIVQALLEKIGKPLAASSANRKGEPPPSTAVEAYMMLGDAVKLILDGGECTLGQASTVLDMSVDVPLLLRDGSITRKQIETVSGISLQ